ncbi:unnamed protein product [Caenorhabditis angaria]|uniref:Glycosyltransferase family 92 protein n=1 Tax=Caenorhabditis angaria TaxID=860376 RepID=A0A9P1N791_9PELO|nr:unnamed protein product [Caenorhabditis angaria]
MWFMNKTRYFLRRNLKAFLVFNFIAVITVSQFSGSKQTENITINNELLYLQHTHTFIHSAYYYPDSKSLGKNAIAIVTTTNKRTVNEILNMKINIVASNDTGIMKTEATVTTEHRLEDRCDYLMLLAQANTLDNMNVLEIEADGVSLSIPYKIPKKVAPKPVVFCVAPQFAAEQWQTFLAQVHISKFYGAHLQMYVVSMVESYFQLLQEYEKLGYLSIEPWLTIKFSKVDEPVMEPNRNVELRAQTAAHTDCLLMYKEAAEFIGSLDMDDLLIPVNSSSYYEMFERDYNGNWRVSALHYTKYDYETIKSPHLDETSIMAMVKQARYLNTIDSGKSFVRSERYNSTWAHWSRVADSVPQFFGEIKPKPFYMYRKQMRNTGMFHFKRQINKSRKELAKLGEGTIPLNPRNNESLIISEEDLQAIEDDLQRHLALPQIQKLAPHLPKDDFYMPIILKCYTDAFYHIRDLGKFSQDEICVNAYSCDIPQQHDYSCVHSDAMYHSGPRMDPITYHYTTDSFFTKSWTLIARNTLFGIRPVFNGSSQLTIA